MQISLIKINKHFKTKNEKIKVFKNLNMYFFGNGAFLFLGESGSGKSTLLKIIGGIEKQSSGKIYPDKAKLNKNSTYMSQKIELIPYLKIKEYLFILKIDNNILKKLNLLTISNKYPHQISKGERQRVALLINLYSTNRIILLDEPTSSLDEKNANLALKLISNMSKENQIFIASHNLKSKLFFKKNYTIKNKFISKIVYVNKKHKEKEESKKIRLHFNFIKALFYYKKYFFPLLLAFMFMFFLFIFIFNSNDSMYLFIKREKLLNDNPNYLLEICDKKEYENFSIDSCRNLNKDEKDLLKTKGVNLYYNKEIILNKMNENSNYKIYLTKNKHSNENKLIVSSHFKEKENVTLSFKHEFEKNGIKDIYLFDNNYQIEKIKKESKMIKEAIIYMDISLGRDILKGYVLENISKNEEKEISALDYFKNSSSTEKSYISFENRQMGDIEFSTKNGNFFDEVEKISEDLGSSFQKIVFFNLLIFSFYIFNILRKMYKEREKEIFIFKNNHLNIKKCFFYYYFEIVFIKSLSFLLAFFLFLILANIINNYLDTDALKIFITNLLFAYFFMLLVITTLFSMTYLKVENYD